MRALLRRAAIPSSLATIVLPGVALAHTGPPPVPLDLWTSWSFDPLVIAGLACAAWLYCSGLKRIWERGGVGRRVSVPRAQCFMAGLAVVFVALLSPLDALSSALFSAHMVQHLLLILVAAPLLVLGAPLVPGVRALPNGWRRGVGRLAGSAAVQRSWRFLRRPVVAWILAAGTLWTWHIPAFYDAALRSAPIHALEHACLLGSSLLFWSVALAPVGKRRPKYGVAIVSLLTMALQSSTLGIALTFSSSPWYAGYTTSTSAWGLTPVVDQQLAGLIMWIPAGVVYLGAALAIIGCLMYRDERHVGLAMARGAAPNHGIANLPEDVSRAVEAGP